ncbi:hypothetical protein GSI_08106 [Ganoderma sinense ZZ0214-1]|uniref:Uncharacterized protein n=1 Tax=Ganoderma sinense ZZ0214-1 TaxID=1077348 RepID=A0A2G8S804_9APHY|nr:hypothetical protein GSI_08106 [Ganoderma sinense ZZ0214-1]
MMLVDEVIVFRNGTLDVRLPYQLSLSIFISPSTTPHPAPSDSRAWLNQRLQRTRYNMRFTSPIRVACPRPIPGLRLPSPSVLRLLRIKPRYSDRRGHVRGHLWENTDDMLCELTGDDEAGMYWTVEDYYIESVILQHGLKPIGWLPDIPFQNLSNIRGGVSALMHLERRWESGILRFARMMEDERLTASLNTEHLTPAPKFQVRALQGSRWLRGHRPWLVPVHDKPVQLRARHPKTDPRTPNAWRSDTVIGAVIESLFLPGVSIGKRRLDSLNRSRSPVQTRLNTPNESSSA